jgi:hypothetical protein
VTIPDKIASLPAPVQDPIQHQIDTHDVMLFALLARVVKLEEARAGVAHPPPLDPAVWTTVKCAAGITGFSFSGIWVRIRNKKIESKKRGGKRYVKLTSLLPKTRKNKKTS